MKMNKTFRSILAGVLAGAVTFAALPAIADGIDALFNSVRIRVNGEEKADFEENYVLASGREVPMSILYGSTTYLPIRKISELTGVSIDWEDATRTVVLDTSSLISQPEQPQTDVVNTSGGYDPWMEAPDFGKFYGIDELSTTVTVYATTHWYDVKAVTSADSYVEKLTSLGFEKVTEGEILSRFKVYRKNNTEVWLDLGMYTNLVYGVTVADTTRPASGREYEYVDSKELVPSFADSMGCSCDSSDKGEVFYGDWAVWASVPCYLRLLEDEGFTYSKTSTGYYGKGYVFKKGKASVTVKFDGIPNSTIPAFLIGY